MKRYFNNVETLEQLRKQYKELLKKHHPDNANGSTEATQEINAEYDKLFKVLKGSVLNFVSMPPFLIPEAGCGQNPRILINTGFPNIFDEENPSKSKVQRHKINYTLY